MASSRYYTIRTHKLSQFTGVNILSSSETTRARAKVSNMVNLLHEVSASRLGEVAVLFNAEKPPQRVKENGKTEEFFPNETTR